jgi:glutamate racemase
LKPIGVFDSGVGGLTVVEALRKTLPDESILYLGDTARLPYGTKSARTVTRYTQRNVDFLLERGVKAIVVACNTASALAMDDLKSSVPTWGVIEPGAEAAAAISGGRVGIVATESTVESGAYPAALARYRPELEILSEACPLFVPLVEEGWHEDPVARTVAERYLTPLVESGIDTLILGCTHYPLLSSMIADLMGPDVHLVDSAGAVAERVAKEMRELGLVAKGAALDHHFCVTDSAARFRRLAERILGDKAVSLELVELQSGDAR